MLTLFTALLLPLSDYMRLPANPVEVGVKLAASSPVTRKIQAEYGGELTLITARGDVIQLIIPPKSLTTDTEISLQEVTSLTHPEFPTTNARYLGVEISPNGTQLAMPATLVFKPKTPITVEKLTPMTSDASGNDLGFATVSAKPSPNEVRLALTHFSNYTVYDGPTVDDIISAGLSKNDTMRMDNWFNHRLLESQRTGGDVAGIANQLFTDMANQVVIPAASAAASCGSAQNALELYLGLTRQIQLLGGDPSSYLPADLMTTLISKNEKECFEHARKACYDDHRPAETVRFALNYMRADQIMGLQGFSKFYELADKCMHFKFLMESEFWVGESRTQNSTGLTAKAEFSFALSYVDRSFTEGSIMIDNAFVNFEGLNCDKTLEQVRPAELSLSNFILDNNPADDSKFEVLMMGLLPYSQHSWECYDPSEPGSKFPFSMPQITEGSYWGGMFMGTHGPTGLNEMRADAVFSIRGWEVRYDRIYAQKMYNHNLNELNETTSMIIYHTPEPL